MLKPQTVLPWQQTPPLIDQLLCKWLQSCVRAASVKGRRNVCQFGSVFAIRHHMQNAGPLSSRPPCGPKVNESERIKRCLQNAPRRVRVPSGFKGHERSQKVKKGHKESLNIKQRVAHNLAPHQHLRQRNVFPFGVSNIRVRVGLPNSNGFR